MRLFVETTDGVNVEDVWSGWRMGPRDKPTSPKATIGLATLAHLLPLLPTPADNAAMEAEPPKRNGRW
jgi:hypothetical protein